jgi:pimeloyl-ACP methyl ester carboxylesterase
MNTFTTSDGVRIAYVIDDFSDPWKTPSTLIMLHSAMGSAKRFYSMVPGLARHFRVVRLDTRGHGHSQVPPADTVMNKERVMLDVVEALDHLELGAVHVLGNSAGGYAAQQLAIHRPERVRSLMLYGSTPGFKGEQGKQWLKAAAERGMRPVFTETIGDRFPIGQVDQRLVDWFIDEICKNDLAWLARYIGYWTDTDFMDEVSAIRCPTLVVAPGAEPIGAVSLYGEMKKRIPNCQVIEYEGARHNICDYLPERCVGDALHFLRKHFPSDF